MKDCVFCMIAKGKADAIKIWENDEFLAFLDGNPNVKGMTIVLPKKHYDSYAFDMPNAAYQRFMLATKKVARILERGLDVKRVAMVMEGMGINHAHIKLYPLHGLAEKFEEIWAKERVFFDKYEGYITTQLGPKAGRSELRQLAEDIKRKSKF